MSYAKLEVVVQGKKEELVVAKGEYESLSHQSVELDEFKSGKIDNQLVLQLNEAIKHRDELTEKIKSKRELRMSYVNENEQLESKLKDLRRMLKDIQGQINEKAILSTKYEGSLNNYLSRLSNEYSMTYEYASLPHPPPSGLCPFRFLRVPRPARRSSHPVPWCPWSAASVCCRRPSGSSAHRPP